MVGMKKNLVVNNIKPAWLRMRYILIVRSDCLITIPIPYHVPPGGGVATVRGGGFSGLNAKPDTNNQPYLTICIPVRVSEIYFGLNAMINPRKSISGLQLVEAVLKKIRKCQIGLILN
jgi:hypothetical protein